MSSVAGAARGPWPVAHAGAASEGWAPLMLAAAGASLVAARVELIALSLAVSVIAAAAVRAPRARPGWTRMLLVTVCVAVLANLYLVRGAALPLPLPVLLGAHASREGLQLGAVLALRLVAVAFAMRVLAALWPAQRAADEVAGRLGLLRRLGLPVDSWRAVLGLALRFVPLIRAEAVRIGALQSLRAGRPPRRWSERLTRLRAALVPTLVAALERAEQVSLALEARHHRLRPARVSAWPRPAVLGGVAWFAAACLWRR